MFGKIVNCPSLEAVLIRDFAGTGSNHAPDDLGRMARAQHGADRLFAGRPVGLGRRERPDSALFGEAQGRRPGAASGFAAGRLGVFIRDPGGPQ